MNSFTRRIRRIEDDLNIIDQRNESRIKLSEEDRKIAMEVARPLARSELKQLGSGQTESDIRSETTRICKKVAKKIQDEQKNG